MQTRPAEIIAVVGPTGSGKSALAIALAQRLKAAGIDAEIVNSDAMQLYRGLDIGTAKLTSQQRGGIAHHLIDSFDFEHEVTVAEYQGLARAIIEELIGDGKVPILVGGSMLYVTAVLGDFAFHARDEGLRASLEGELALLGPGILHERLERLDPVAASKISPLNGRRVVRALEITLLEGAGFEAELPEAWSSWRPVCMLGLNGDREALKLRIASRVAEMWRARLIDEVSELLGRGFREAKTASVAIGYSQAIAQLDGRMTETEAQLETIRLTQRYLRRQLSWFRRDPRIRWFDFASPTLVEDSLGHVIESLGRPV